MVSAPDARYVFIDSCAVNRFALINVDPARELAGSAFRLALTPELEAEYRQAHTHLFVPSYVRKLIGKLLEASERDGWLDAGAAPSPRGGADPQLVTLVMTEIVITDDVKQIRRWAESRPGLLAWSAVERHLRDEGRLLDLLQQQARHLPPAGRS